MLSDMDLDSDSDSKSDSEYSFNSNDEMNINSELSLGLVKCNSLAFLQNYEKYIHLEFSNNIILPHQYLNEIQNSYGSLEFPLYFELNSNSLGMSISLKCTGNEFIEGIDNIFVPNRIMNNLLIDESTEISLKYVKDIKIGEKIKIQPHTTDFLDIEDHKKFLEESLLNNYNILTQGETIEVKILDKSYYIDIIETKPDLSINICNTDIEVDFEKPLDYKEPPPPPPPPPPPQKVKPKKEEKKVFVPFSGKGRRLGD